MKNRVVITLVLTALLGLPAHAEYRQVELKIFGMD
jgi:hypothetical protein